MIAAYQSGINTNELARQYGCDRKTICNQLKKRGVEVSINKIKSEEAVRRIIILYEENHTIEEIAKQFGVSAATINKLLHKHGVSIRSRWDYK